MGGSFPAPPRREEALAFIIERIARSGRSPTRDEIGERLGVSPQRADQLVEQLIARGLVERTAGEHRSLRVRDVAGSRLMLEDVLRNLGWIAADPLGPLIAP